jgi:hypothetical protein
MAQWSGDLQDGDPFSATVLHPMIEYNAWPALRGAGDAIRSIMRVLIEVTGENPAAYPERDWFED